MSAAFPIRYVDPVFRPPSEADSLILPVTDGCSWNHCTFCEMYTAPQKKFRARDAAETLEALRRCGERFGSDIRRVFLADGDALVLTKALGVGVATTAIKSGAAPSGVLEAAVASMTAEPPGARCPARGGKLPGLDSNQQPFG